MPSDKHVDINAYMDARPVRSELLSWAEVVQLTGSHPSRIGELIELGWVAPVVTSTRSYLFRVRDVYRIRKYERLCRDFELNSVGGTIVVDLLERIEQLQVKIDELERLIRG